MARSWAPRLASKGSTARPGPALHSSLLQAVSVMGGEVAVGLFPHTEQLTKDQHQGR